MLDRSVFLQAACAIGNRIVSQAHWLDAASCTWTIMAPDLNDRRARRAAPAPAGGGLYSGTAGIALFLVELCAIAGDRRVEQAALGALEHSLAFAEDLPHDSFGFHTGRVGVAYVAGRAADLLDEDHFRQAALKILEPLVGNEAQDRGLDVIGGAAGAIPALLHLAFSSARELPFEMALSLGEHLIRTAEREPEGWSWKGPSRSHIRNLCGLAHGAAGAGHALLELHAATGDQRFRHAGEQAFLYERSFFSSQVANWADLRHKVLGEYVFEQRLDELRQLLLSGETIGPQAPTYTSFWCHGAPGIGLTRIRAYEVLERPVYLQESKTALKATRRWLSSTPVASTNHSLCHGICGNAETLLYGDRVLGEPALREAVHALAVEGWERHEKQGQPWRCGTVGGVSDPSLMLGESGIGLFFLRLYSHDVRPVLLVTIDRDEASPPAPVSKPPSVDRLRRESIDAHFPLIVAVLDTLDKDVSVLWRAPEEDSRTVVESAYERICRRIDRESDSGLKGRLRDAFRVERARFRLARSYADYTAEFVRRLSRPDPADISWQEARFWLAPFARVVLTRWDWEGWLASGGNDLTDAESAHTFHLLSPNGNGNLRIRRLGPLAGLVLGILEEEPASLDQILARIRTMVDSADRKVLAPNVLAQLEQAYRANLVDTSASGTRIDSSSDLGSMPRKPLGPSDRKDLIVRTAKLDTGDNS